MTVTDINTIVEFEPDVMGSNPLIPGQLLHYVAVCWPRPPS